MSPGHRIEAMLYKIPTTLNLVTNAKELIKPIIMEHNTKIIGREVNEWLIMLIS